MSQVSDFRKKIMHHGDVFSGTNKIKNQGQRNMIEAERHNKWMDMQGIQKIDPVVWVKSFVKGRQKDYVQRYIEDIIKSYGSVDHPSAQPYYNSKNAKKTLAFYKNALGYLRNHY